MFVGHLAVALVARRVEPRVNLGWFVAGVTALDLVWPIFVLMGVERVRISPGATEFTPFAFEYYPWSHSLLMSFVWGLLLVAIARTARVPSPAWPLLLAAVVSHWVLDFVTHAPDMPLWPGDSPEYGLTLWDSIPGTFVVEGAMWIAGIALYMNALARSNRRPGWPFWSMVLVCTVMWAAGPFSPPPPDASALGWFGLLGWMIVPWAVWADRSTRPSPVLAAS